MSFRIQSVRLDKTAGPFRRTLQYAFYDWQREMPRSKRYMTRAGYVLQAYVIYVVLMWALGTPKWMYAYALVLPQRPLSFVALLVGYYLGYCVVNGMLTSEFVRKTQLESDQLAAQQIQQMLHPERLEPLAGYDIDTFYQPVRGVGGDYFDVVELPDNKTLFALADVSGKGMPAALLAANIQALVRSIASTTSDPVALASQINKHLVRYTPSDRFATAVFVVMNRDSGELVYVNAGHNEPILSGLDSATSLKATGLPLGLMSDAEYEAGTATITPGGALLLYTDGLTDSIADDEPESRLRGVLAGDPKGTMSNIKSLVNPRFKEDDVTILLVRRATLGTLSRVSAAPSKMI